MSTDTIVMMETILIIGMTIACTLIMCSAAVMVSHIYSNIAVAKAEINESGKTRRERINVRADMQYDDGYEEEASGSVSEIDSIARAFGYDSAASALSSPEVLAKLGVTSQPKQEVE